MPHLRLDYTDNLPGFSPRPLLLALNKTLLASGQFSQQDIKSRAYVLDDFVLGVEENNRAFVHVGVSLLSGRSMEIKKKLSEELYATLQENCKAWEQQEVQLSVEILDMERETYSKGVLGE